VESALSANQKLSREAALTGEFLASGAEDSFTALFSTCTPRLLSFYRPRGCEATLAEDLAQEVMLKVYLRARQLRDRSRFRAWLFSIARNTLARHHAKRTREVETFDIQDGIERVPASKAEPAGAPFEFMSWMERLETRERGIMMLRFIEDWEYHEIAAAKSIPVGTVQWRVFNAEEAGPVAGSGGRAHAECGVSVHGSAGFSGLRDVPEPRIGRKRRPT
jgi:RNA polymerase sigma-70 factor (ECF subfamily)